MINSDLIEELRKQSDLLRKNNLLLQEINDKLKDKK